MPHTSHQHILTFLNQARNTSSVLLLNPSGSIARRMNGCKKATAAMHGLECSTGNTSCRTSRGLILSWFLSCCMFSSSCGCWIIGWREWPGLEGVSIWVCSLSLTAIAILSLFYSWHSLSWYTLIYIHIYLTYNNPARSPFFSSSHFFLHISTSDLSRISLSLSLSLSLFFVLIRTTHTHPQDLWRRCIASPFPFSLADLIWLALSFFVIFFSRSQTNPRYSAPAQNSRKIHGRWIYWDGGWWVLSCLYFVSYISYISYIYILDGDWLFDLQVSSKL